MAQEQEQSAGENVEPTLDKSPVLTDAETALSIAKIEGQYNANDFLRALKGLEAVRMRPGMYVGDTNVNGLHHLFKEIIDNAIDEVLAGYCTEINVVYGADYSLSVEDNGRSVSVDVHKESGKTGVEGFLTELRWVGRFGDSRGYKVAPGLHGVGASCVNALSTWLECEVKHDGKIHRQRFERGVPTGPLAIVGECGTEEHGTKITWLADDTMFRHALDAQGRLNYSPDRLRTRIREMAFLNKEVFISLHDAHHNKEPEIFHFERGITDYVAFLNEGKNPLHEDVITIYAEEDETQVEIALQYNGTGEENIVGFANNLFLRDGGTSMTGFKTGLTRAVNRYARKNGFLKTGDANFSSGAVREGLTAVVSVRLTNPQFEAATKDKLTTLETEGIISRAAYKGLMAFLNAHPQAAHTIMDKMTTAKRVN